MKTKTKIFTAAALIMLAGTSISYAYFTDTASKDNVFTVGSVRSILHEDKWDAYPDENANDIPDIAENIVPMNTINKDPKVENTGKNAFYAYIQVDMPVINAVTVGDDGAKKPQAATELFRFTPAESWEQLSKTVKDGKAIYVFGYKQAVAPGKTTETLFDTVQFENFIEAQGLEDQKETITVKSMCVQAEETGTMQEAYEKFIAQNPIHKVGE